ncbi:MAG: hypothetical protein IK004_03200, partial [Bacteroidales bacterium]|nr:hypothetical protein [Bacteroidales bacterium]
ADSPVPCLLELKGSLPFRLLFVGSLLSKNSAIPISVDCGCKSTHFFLSRNTFFKKNLKYFLHAENQRIAEGNFSGRGKKQAFEARFQTVFCPSRKNFYANVVIKPKKVINF